jgi:transcriptional regulator with PAS, ATPase and Fis domain
VENQRRAHGAMEKAHGDAGKAAQTLRISVRTLYRWLGGS